MRGESLVEGLDPTLERTRSEFLPWLYRRDGDTRLRNFQAIGPMLSVIDSASSNYDIYGHLLRFQGAGWRRAIADPARDVSPTSPTRPPTGASPATRSRKRSAVLFGPAQEVGDEDGGLRWPDEPKITRRRMAPRAEAQPPFPDPGRISRRRDGGGDRRSSSATSATSGLGRAIPPSTASFANVEGVTPGTQEVRLAGIPVGVIKAAGLVDGEPTLTLSISRRVRADLP